MEEGSLPRISISQNIPANIRKKLKIVIDRKAVERRRLRAEGKVFFLDVRKTSLMKTYFIMMRCKNGVNMFQYWSGWGGWVYWE